MSKTWRVMCAMENKNNPQCVPSHNEDQLENNLESHDSFNVWDAHHT
jgi:invasion protein IalB